MANNRIILKRTNIAGRTPNTTGSYVTNSQYISAGELALNMADGILYSSNGSAVIEIGANNVNQRITNSLTIDSNKALRFQTVNTSAVAYFIQQNDDNFVFYTTNTSYGARPVYSIFANSNSSELSFATPVRFNGNVTALTANGSLGSAGQVLTSNGSTVYWSSAGGGSGTVTSVGSGNGLTGGTITNTGTLSVLANTGIVVNATGVFVNATYINTISSNSATFANSSVTNTFTVGTASYFVANGNLGIGTSSPVEKLHVSSGAAEFAIQWDSTGSNSWVLGSATNRAYIRNKTSGAEVLTILNGGNVGIGTTTAAQALQVNSSIRATLGGTNSIAEIRGGNQDGAVIQLFRAGNTSQFAGFSQFQGSLFIKNVDTGPVVFTTTTSDTERMRITSAGDVGIGNTAPNAKLQVTGTANVSGNVAIAGITTFSGNIVVENTSANSQVFQRSSNATVNVVSISTTASPTGGSPTNSLSKITTQSTGRYVETRIQSGVSQGLIEAYATNDNNQIYSSITGTATASSTAAGPALLDVQYQNNITFKYSRIRVHTANNQSYIEIEKDGTSFNTVESNQIRVLDASGANSIVNTTAVSTSNSVIYGGGRITLVSNAGIVANGSLGTAGQVLHSNGSSAYWADDDQGVTSVATGNGLTGGTITSTGTLSVLANTGLIANATGIYVNAAYINTISSNSATFANSSVTNTFTVGTASYFVANGNLGVGTSSPSDIIHSALAPSPSGLTKFGHRVTTTGTQYGARYLGYIDQGVESGAIIETIDNNVSTERIRIIANGHVGIGNTAPFGRLTVQKAAGQSVGGELYLTEGTYWTQFNSRSSAGAYNPLVQAGDHSIIYTDGAANTGALVIGQWSPEARGIRIDAGGNVGISNSAPNARLAVTGTANVSGNVVIGGTLSSGQLTSRRTDTQTGYAEVASIVQNYSSTNTSILGFGQISNNRMFIESRDENNVKGTLSLQPYGGSVTVAGVTTFSANVILGSSGLSANGGFGTAGQVLHSNGTATYWAADDNSGGTVTSVASGNGITGGTITTTGTLTAVAGAGVVVNTSGINVLANTGIVANSTGTFVNATYIGTLSANNASFLGGTAAASYVQNTDSRTLSGNLTFTGANVFFSSPTLGGTSTNFVNNFTISTNVGNGSFLRFYHYRHTTGADWTGVSTRIQQRIDVTDQGYLEYNPSGYTYGMGLFGSSGVGLTVSQTGQSIFGNTVFLGSVGLSANGGLGTAGHVLHSNGTATYWATATASVNTAAQFAWTNTHTFSANVTIGNSTTNNNALLISQIGISNPNSFTGGTLTTVNSLNTLIVGPYTVASGNTLNIVAGSRIVII